MIVELDAFTQGLCKRNSEVTDSIATLPKTIHNTISLLSDSSSFQILTFMGCIYSLSLYLKSDLSYSLTKKCLS